MTAESREVTETMTAMDRWEAAEKRVEALDRALTFERENHDKTKARCETLSLLTSDAHEAARRERERIVAWLRSERVAQNGTMACSDDYADAIEKGAHDDAVDNKGARR